MIRQVESNKSNKNDPSENQEFLHSEVSRKQKMHDLVIKTHYDVAPYRLYGNIEFMWRICIRYRKRLM